MSKDVPMISRLIRDMIVENYEEALNIVTDEKFDPNERSKTMDSPVISALIIILGGTKPEIIGPKSREIFKLIVNNPKFDPNAYDTDRETILMHIARNRKFNWLAPFVLNNPKTDLSLKNIYGRDVTQIAGYAKNQVVVDLLLTFNIKFTSTHSPKKRVGVKKKAAVVSVTSKALDKIEKAFLDSRKDDPFSLYNLIKYFLNGNYEECMRIVTNVHFNPNETDRWEEPALSSLIYYSQDSEVKYDEDKFKEIAKAIINHRQFDVNALDCDCNTVLMVAMGFPRLDWLVKELFRISSARIDVINDMGEDLQAIADKCGNSELYSDMIRRSYETANVVS